MAKPVWATNDVPTATDFNEWLTNINYVEKASDTSRNTTTTLADDPELSVPVLANAKYKMTGLLIYSATSAAGGDLNVGWAVPASATILGHVSGNAQTGTVVADDLNSSFSESTVMSLGVINTAAPWTVALLTARVSIGATAGNIVLRWCQSTSSGINTVMRVGSFLDLERRS